MKIEATAANLAKQYLEKCREQSKKHKPKKPKRVNNKSKKLGRSTVAGPITQYHITFTI